jgi:Raf kinase inhibitor-like YbhB/YbcL family protein
MRKRYIIMIAAAYLLIFAGCSKGKAAVFSLSSSDVEDGGALPQRFAYTACGGDNINPALAWSNPPEGTKGFAITLIDLNSQGWTHWIMYDIPSSVASLASGAVPDGAAQATDSFGAVGYGGPCPPAGSSHQYQFKVWALDVAKASAIYGFVANSTGQFIHSLGDHVLGMASFDVTYSH